MKKLFLSMFVAFITFFSLTTIPTLANAHWYHDGYGYVSNVCRAGGMWQVVPYDYIDTSCFMPGWGVWGKRVAE